MMKIEERVLAEQGRVLTDMDRVYQERKRVWASVTWATRHVELRPSYKPGSKIPWSQMQVSQ